MNNFQYLLYEQELIDVAEQLGQSNNHKILITDVAISKIPYVVYPDLDINENLIVHELCEFLLKESRDKNNSNEVMLTYDFDNKLNIKNGFEYILEKTGICYGTINQTDLFSDTLTQSIIMRAKNVAVLSIHNHPGSSPFSTLDISSFLKETAIKLMIIVGNNGELYYLNKNKNYNHSSARKYLTDAAKIIVPNITPTYICNYSQLKDISELFLKNCKNFGIDYSHVLGTNRELEKINNEYKTTEPLNQESDEYEYE